MKAGVIGASGYLGEELLRLLAVHPDIELAHAQARRAAGLQIGEVLPGLAGAFGSTVFGEIEPGALGDCDVVFVAVPSGASQEIVASLVGRIPLVVDLGADFRLKAPGAYEQWYGFTHSEPELLAKAVYGLPEFFRGVLSGANFIAAPGCYVTAASLALVPLVRQGVIAKEGIIVDAASGTSGAGRDPGPTTHHGSVNENFTAYKLLDHRHTPEMEQVIGASLLFTPHLAPMTRGILATCYARPIGVHSTEELIALLEETYHDEPFVQVGPNAPSTRSTYGSNTARLTARYDVRTSTVMVLCALDNLTKGGSGQAIQAANVALGLNESAGLSRIAVTP